jgi:hypothetical protein
MKSTKAKPSLFPFGTFVSITDFLRKTHKCLCINEDMAELIRSLAEKNMQNSPDGWCAFSRYAEPGSRGGLRARRRTLEVYENEHGFVVCRRFPGRGMNGLAMKKLMLAHQLIDATVVFPSLEHGKAAAALCYPEPNPELGYLWWTYPEIR